jgi:hypothetical protein
MEMIPKIDLIHKWGLPIHGVDITEVEEAFKIITFLKLQHYRAIQVFKDGVIVEKI